jgi:hypothetical protein
MVSDAGKLPSFTADGLLPVGTYELTFDELRKSALVAGPSEPGLSWDSAWRLQLVDNASLLVHQLLQVGITEIFLDGSFVEDKDHPNDIDGYFHCDLMRLASGDLERDLNLLDPHHIWTWKASSRRPFPGSTKKQLPMWHQYRVELYPHYGQPSGIVDEFGNQLEFPSAFRRSRRNGTPKGIVKLKL